MNDLLSICIPTYNRAKMLGACLANLISEVREHEIPIYVSDNASTDNTAEIVANCRKDYSFIFYSRNKANLVDRNFIVALQLPKTKFRWLLNDKARLLPGALGKLLANLQANDPDALVVNSSVGGAARGINKRVKDVAGERVYSEQNEFLADLGWHITMLGSVVWSEKLVKAGDFEKYTDTSFIQPGVIMGYIAGKKFSILWRDEALFYLAGEELSTWVSIAFEPFARQWYQLIMSLPASYLEEVKYKCIKDHGLKSRLFTFTGFLVLWGMGNYDLKLYRQYSRYFPYVTNVPKWLLWALAAIPAPGPFVRLVKRAVIWARGWKRNWQD